MRVGAARLRALQGDRLWPRYVWRRDGEGAASRSRSSARFACPICSQPLEWHGGCYQCHGSRTPWDRDTWTFPGDRYERVDDDHWEKIDGPHPACTPAQNREAAALVKRVLAGELKASEAFEQFPFKPVEEPRR